MNDLNNPTAKRASMFLWVVMLGFSGLIGWASVARVDQVTRVQGQVIAAGRTQQIQSTDGGVISQLLVKEGESVKAGQKLAVLETKRAQVAVNDSLSRVAALRAARARLSAEMRGQPLSFDADLQAYPEYVQNQRDLYQRRKQAIDQEIAALERLLGLARDELAMNEKIFSFGDVSQADILRLQRQVADLEAQIVNRRNRYFEEAQQELTKVQEELDSQSEQLRDRQQVLSHTDLIAPVDGLVKNISMHTLGGVLRPAETLMELVPTNSQLIVEVKVSPADIAEVKLGQSALVKLDAYDYSIFGSLNGNVSYLSPDTLREDTQQGPAFSYRAHIRVSPPDPNDQRAKQIQIRPGMTASVEIKSRDRTILSYLTKPIIKTWDQSLGER
jgi:adhesin transport system membrane fusion protein